jgi:Mlc titration factor MtfA (ptsG expression regulator)
VSTVLSFPPELAFSLAGVFVLMLLLGVPWWARQRRWRLRQRPFPLAWRRVLQQHWALYRHLPPPLQQRLLGMVQVFVAEKPIIGCQGLHVTDEMRVLIAAQACLMVLHLHAQPGMAPFPELRQILLYPSAFVVKATHAQPGGVLSSGREVRLGESWQHGQVVLSWPDVDAGSRSGQWPALALRTDWATHNVVIHEFAHQLDQ